MRQQINLYQPIFSEERKLFSAGTVGAGLGVVAAALIALSVHAEWRVNELARQVDQLRAEQSNQETLLAKAGELQAARSKPVAIETRVKELTTSLAARKTALTVLQSGAAGQTSGFAQRLEALARRHVEGLWIDSMVLSGTNGSMTLAGGTLNADIVPAYLHSLAREPVLSGTRFDDFVIERTDKRIRFRAGSKSLAAPRAEAPT